MTDAIRNPGPKPNSRLVWAILTTVFGFLPFGVVSIVYAVQVDVKWYAGDHVGARDSSERAQNWAFASAVCGIVALFIVAVIATA